MDGIAGVGSSLVFVLSAANKVREIIVPLLFATKELRLLHFGKRYVYVYW